MSLSFFKNLFRRENPIDKLLRIHSNEMTVWNGINVCGEMMFRRGYTDDCHLGDGDYYCEKPEDYPNFVQLSFGSINLGFGDWAGGFDTGSTSAVRMYVTDRGEVVCYSVAPEATGEYRKTLCKIGKQILKDRSAVVAGCSNQKLKEVLSVLGNMPKKKLYSTFMMFSGKVDEQFLRIVNASITQMMDTHGKGARHE